MKKQAEHANRKLKIMKTIKMKENNGKIRICKEAEK